MTTYKMQEGVKQSKGINNKPIDCVKYAPKEEISGCGFNIFSSATSNNNSKSLNQWFRTLNN